MKYSLAYFIKKLLPKKSFSNDYLVNKVNKKYYFHKNKELVDTIKIRLLNFDLNLSELNINQSLKKFHHIDLVILKKVFKNNPNILENLFTNDNIYTYTEYSKYYFSLEVLAKKVSRDFYQTLSTCIIQNVYYHDNCFKDNDLYIKQYYTKKNKNLILYNLYSLSLNTIKFEENIYYSHEKLYVNTYNLIDKELNSNLIKAKKHKRNIAVDCKKQVLKIYNIEKDGTAYKTYYPFYKFSKKNFEIFINNQNYIFLLKTNEVNQLVDLLIRLFSKEIKKNKELKNDFKNDLKKFFSNDYEHPVTSTFKKYKKHLVYVIYLLSKNDKCNVNLLKKYIFKQTGIEIKLFHKYFNDFYSGEKPETYKLIVLSIDKLSILNNHKTL